MAFTNKKEWCIIHACQSYHYKVMGWSIHRRPNKDDPKYLIYEEDHEMSLNWVDGAAHLYDWYGPEKFSHILDFIDRNIKTKKVFIHCDLGKSRSPSIGLLYLAKRIKIIPGQTFQLAFHAFKKIFPQYSPGGIGIYIESKWQDIV